MTPDQLARFEAKVHVEPNTGCWLWIGATTTDGYGMMSLGRREEGRGYAHRLSYEHYRGEISKSLTVDHLCRNRACCNPGHLELVTRGENVLRGEGRTAANARKTHCKRGHELSGERAESGQRKCKICDRMLAKRRYENGIGAR